MQELVRVRIGDTETNVGAAYATTKGLNVLDEPTTNPDGTLRAATRANSRPRKRKTSVSTEAAKKKGAVIESAPANEEND